MDKPKISKFTDLTAWREGHALVLAVYKLTQDFPSVEQFGLISQMRRAAVSVTSNIAEGFSRQSYKDKVHFYSIAQGSLTELQNQILISKDVAYLKPADFENLSVQTVICHKLLNGLIKSSKEKYHDS